MKIEYDKATGDCVVTMDDITVSFRANAEQLAKPTLKKNVIENHLLQIAANGFSKAGRQVAEKVISDYDALAGEVARTAASLLQADPPELDSNVEDNDEDA